MQVRSKVLMAMVGFGVIAGLAACTHEGAQAMLTPPSSLAPASTGSSHALVFSDDGANAKLALADGPAALMLECAHGSGAIHVTHASTAAPAATLSLVALGTTVSMTAERQAFEGQTLVLGETPLNTPALEAFRTSGRLSVRYGDEGLTADAHPEGFFKACAAAA